jgi:hypothetical protein
VGICTARRAECGGYEQFFSQDLLDRYTPETLLDNVNHRLHSIWPKRREDCLRLYLETVATIGSFGQETFQIL